MRTGLEKIDYTTKTKIMVGYIDRSDNVVAVECGWETTPEALGRRFITKISNQGRCDDSR